MEKTSMQELIELLSFEITQSPRIESRETLRRVKAKATELLEKEREDMKSEIWKAIVQYQIARKDMKDVIEEAPEWFDQYFNETYEQ